MCDASCLLASEALCPEGCGPTGCLTRCGDGTLDPGETCDDGNTDDSDGCSADCQSDESCGNGIIDIAAGEVCDDANTDDSDGCSADCQSDESCGNGIIDTAAGEVCDDGNTDDSDGCAADCRSDESCGNGIIDAAVGEECDDTSTADWDGCDACTVTDVQVNTYTVINQYQSSIAAAADGRFVVVWSSIAQVDIQYHPTVAMAGDGRFVVSWVSEGNGISPDIFAQRYDASGNQQGAELQVNTYTDLQRQFPAVSMNDGGEFLIAWESYYQDFDYYGIFGQRFDSNGQTVGVEFRINRQNLSSQENPSVALLTSGKAVVSWDSLSQDPEGWGVFHQRFDAAGLPMGSTPW